MERIGFEAYLFLSVGLNGFTFPVVAYWIWGSNTWLGINASSPILDVGFIDSAGGAAVHLVGGAAAFGVCKLLGPRISRNTPNDWREVPSSSSTLQALGTGIIFFATYAFNTGGFFSYSILGTACGRIFTVTTICTASCALMMSLYRFIRYRDLDLTNFLVGIRSGLVASSAIAAVVEPWGGFVTGVIMAILVQLGLLVSRGLRLDDPADSLAVHCLGGFWSVICVGLWAKPELLQEVYGVTSSGGLVYSGGPLIGMQAIGAAVIFCWGLVNAAILCILTKFFLGAAPLRVSSEAESTGLDRARHGGPAPEDLRTSGQATDPDNMNGLVPIEYDLSAGSKVIPSTPRRNPFSGLNKL